MSLPWDAIVLAGGRGSRLGEATKPAVVVGGIPLLERVLASVTGAHHVVVVGDPQEVPPGHLVTREEPPFGGPAAGIAAGMQELAGLAGRAPWTVLLACDLPLAPQAVAALLAAIDEGLDPAVDGISLADETGRTQWLLGAYRTAALESALTQLGRPRDRSMRALLSPLSLHVLTGWEHVTGDVDTWSDVERWNAVLGQPDSPPEQPDPPTRTNNHGETDE
ncbi:molybdenum cofactor guanylyltransferase [Actinomycetota bacterium]